MGYDILETNINKLKTQGLIERVGQIKTVNGLLKCNIAGHKKSTSTQKLIFLPVIQLSIIKILKLDRRGIFIFLHVLYNS
jgi:hypothetical protein